MRKRNPQEMKDSGIEWIGEYPEDWGLAKLKFLSNVKRGASPRPIDNPKYFDNEGEYSWVRISDVTASNEYLYSTEQTLSPLGASKSVKLEPGELILSIAASVGKPVINKIKCCIHDGFIYFNNLKLDTKFTFYLFKSGEPYKGLGKLGTQLNLNSESVGSIVSPVPPKPEQKAIATFLDRKTQAIDRLIEKKQQLIEKLKEKRQALITQAVTKGLPSEAAAKAGLNPGAPMKDSGIEWLGEIPEHWDLVKFKHSVRLVNKKSEEADFIVALENVESWTGKYLESDSDYKPSGVAFKKGDVLFGKLRPYLAKGYLAKKPGNAIGDFYVFRGRKYNSIYLLMIVLSEIFIDVVDSSTYGAKMPRASWDFIGELKLPVPTLKEQKYIIKQVQAILKSDGKVNSKITKQIKRLKEYRQSLISTAVTGKIDVRDEIEQPELAE